MNSIYNLFNIQGKKAIVTGGTRGLGYAIAEALHMAGADLVLIATDEERLQQACARLGQDGAPVSYVVGDLSNLENIENIYNSALEKSGGHIDILVNNAGVQYRCKAQNFPLDKWKSIIDINLSSVFVLSQLAGNTMIAQGHGKIINIASMTSFFGSEMIPAYAASKGGIMQLTKALSNEWAHLGVNVNAIAPGYMETVLTSDMKLKNPAQFEDVTRRIPAHRWGKPEDLQGAVIFLSSDASNYVTGSILPVDGGYLGK